MINKQLAETARSITDSTDLLRSSIENSSERLTDAVIVSTETAAENAKQIGDRITLLSGVIMMASDDLKSAASPRLGRRLNLLTAVLIFTALISAGTTAFYAWEAKQLVEVMRQQLQRAP